MFDEAVAGLQIKDVAAVEQAIDDKQRRGHANAVAAVTPQFSTAAAPHDLLGSLPATCRVLAITAVTVANSSLWTTASTLGDTLRSTASYARRQADTSLIGQRPFPGAAQVGARPRMVEAPGPGRIVGD